MSGLSGYDSEAVGFDSVTQTRRSEANSSTQTNYSESGVGCQTNQTADFGCNTEDHHVNITKEYTPGLNEFLRKVVPAMMEQLDQNDAEFAYSSDSDDEQIDNYTAKLIQEIKNDMPGTGSGDNQPSILDISFSRAGSSLAVSIGYRHHEKWCVHDGIIRIYSYKRAAQKFVHDFDITEKNCVSTLKYHPDVAGLLAYGTNSGEVVICDLRNSIFDEGAQLTTPSGCHGSKRVSYLQWADATLTSTFLTVQIKNTGKRRSASDHILISSGSDGFINVWQVNVNSKVFESVISYNINGSRKMAAQDITCFDFIKSNPLMPYDKKLPKDAFVVGTKSGQLYLCKIKSCKPIVDSTAQDPVYDMLDGHPTCILDIAFSRSKPGTFASLSMDSELRVYDVNQSCPLKVICLDLPVSCMSWLPTNPGVLLLGLPRDEGALKVYSVTGERFLAVDGLCGGECTTTVAVDQSSGCVVAAGDSAGTLRLWTLPLRGVFYGPECD